MLRRLQEYDQAHSTALLHTLCVYLLQEQNLHATARQLFIHRNTLVYRLQRIRTLLQLDLDDAHFTAGLLDKLLAKKRSSDRKHWLEQKGNLAELTV